MSPRAASVTPIGDLVDVSVPGYRGPVHVRVDGPPDAPVIVAVHGFGGSMGWFGRVLPDLARQYRVVRVDLLGHGGTGGPAADAPLQARVVDDVLARLGVDGVTAIGHSFGADIAVELAQRSGRVDRVMVITQAPDYSDATLPRGRALMTVPVVGAGLHGVGKVLARGMLAGMRRLRPDSPNRDLAELAVADIRALDTAMFRVVLVDRGERMARHPLDAQIAESGKPALVVLGGRDQHYGDRSAGRYRAAGARVEILPESGHQPLIETPERMVELISGFVPSPGGPAPTSV